MQHRGCSPKTSHSILLADLIGHGVKLSLFLVALFVEKRPLRLSRAIKAAHTHAEQPDL
jgi:hypothetical protein